MNDEIKAFLVNIKSNEEWKQIYDYITNLQHTEDLYNQLLKDYDELQQENEGNLKCIKSIKEQLESVTNENQRLLKQWFENNDKTVKLISEKEIYYENFKDYKSRCEKAAEILGRYKHLSSPTEEQAIEQEEIVENAYDILNGKGSDK